MKLHYRKSVNPLTGAAYQRTVCGIRAPGNNASFLLTENEQEFRVVALSKKDIGATVCTRCLKKVYEKD
jgi:hypothetical protein